MTSVLDDFTRKLKSSTLDPLETYKDMAYHYTSIANIDSILPKEGRARLWARFWAVLTGRLCGCSGRSCAAGFRG